jgi:cytochrome P450
MKTTECMIANAVWHLLSHPDQLVCIRANPGLVVNTVEESLRLEPAAAIVDRDDVPLARQTLVGLQRRAAHARRRGRGHPDAEGADERLALRQAPVALVVPALQEGSAS